MNPNIPREEIEMRLTALLLGELSAEEAADLRARMSAEPELAALHGRLQRAVELVREATALSDDSALPPPPALSHERRERLLAHFKSPALVPEAAPPLRRDWKGAVPLGLAAALIALLGGTLLMNDFSFPRQKNLVRESPDFAAAVRSPVADLEVRVPASTEETLSKSMENRLDAVRSSVVSRAVAVPATPAFSVASGGSLFPPPSVIIGQQLAPADAPVAASATMAPASSFRRVAGPNATPAPAGQVRLSAAKDFDANHSPGLLAMNSGVGAAAPETPASPTLNWSFGSDAKGLASPADSRGRMFSGNFGDLGSTSDGKPLPEFSAITTENKPMGAALAGTNSYSGSTTLNGGTLAFDGTAQPLAKSGTGSLSPTTTVDVLERDKIIEAAKLEQPDYYNKSITPRFRANVEEVKKEFAEAQSFYDVGRYDLALKHAEQVLNVDPYNIAARKFQEKVNKSIDEYSVNATNETRSREAHPTQPKAEFELRLNEQKNRVAELQRQVERLNALRPADLADALRTLNIDDPTVQKTLPLYQDAVAEEARLLNSGVGLDHPRLKALHTQKDAYRKALDEQLANIKNAQSNKVRYETDKLSVLEEKADDSREALARMPAAPAVIPQPEVPTSVNAFSTFSLNVSDVAFKLAAASLEQGKMPEPATVRSEEFINAFDYCDPEPAAGAPLAFASERARYPFAQNRDLLRLSVKTAAAGREPGRPLNLVLLLDNSGSMERADRVGILHEALRVLSAQLQPQDKLSVVTFARTPRLWADGVAGDKAGEVTARVGEITPQGGTDISAALDLGYATALRHYQVGSINRVVLLTDGAANLGDVNPAALKQKVEAHRQQGIALDCFGIGWEGLNDDLLEQLSRHGDGRYGFINTPEEAATEFAGQLAGALRVAASDVKVQVEFNPRRVTAYRQVGYAKHQLTKEQFRDNTVDAAELGAAESGNALYVVAVNPRGEGDLATVRVRFKVPGTSDYREHEWSVPFAPNAPPLEQASPALRLAGTASAFSEWLVASPYASEVTPDRLLGLLNGVPANYGADPRPQKLEWMIRQAKSVSGK